MHLSVVFDGRQERGSSSSSTSVFRLTLSVASLVVEGEIPRDLPGLRRGSDREIS